MASFIINTKAELLKIRKTAAYWITLVAGIFIPFIMWLALVFKADHFTKIPNPDPWGALLRNSWQPAAAFLMPMYVILVTSLIVQVEYRGNTWKQVYASPRSYADIFFSKFLIVHLMILSSFILFNLMILFTGFTANAMFSGYTFFAHPVPWEEMWSVSGKLYVSILAMTSIQYWISMRFKNFIAPIGIGLALLITGIMILDWSKVIYYPYAYSALTYFKELSKGRVAPLNYSWIYFVVVMLLAFWDTVRRKERG